MLRNEPSLLGGFMGLLECDSHDMEIPFDHLEQHRQLPGPNVRVQVQVID